MTVEEIRLPQRATTGDASEAILNASLPKLLLIVPAGSSVAFGDTVELARLKRAAEQRGVHLGLVSIEPAIHAAAQQCAIPIYSTRQLGLLGFPRSRPYRTPGKPTVVSDGDRQHASRQLRTRPSWMRAFGRTAAFAVSLLVLAVLAIAAFYLVPSATVTLEPQLQSLFVTDEIIANPRLDAASPFSTTVPAQLLITVEKWQASVETTGEVEVPASLARGTVTMVNLLPEQVTVPAGTRVTTSAGARISFQTAQTVQLDGRIGAQAEVDVVALEPGAIGNVGQNGINRVDGALASRVSVNNAEALEGGGNRIAKAVTAADQERLREHLLNELRRRATQTLRADLEDGFVISEASVRVVAIYAETFTNSPGQEANRLTLEMRAELHGTAVEEAQVLALGRRQLENAVPDDFWLQEESIDIRLGRIIGSDARGNVLVEVESGGVAVANLPVAPVLDNITGQERDNGLAYLFDSLPLRSFPDVDIRPNAFERFPYTTARIKIVNTEQ